MYVQSLISAWRMELYLTHLHPEEHHLVKNKTFVVVNTILHHRPISSRSRPNHPRLRGGATWKVGFLNELCGIHITFTIVCNHSGVLENVGEWWCLLILPMVILGLETLSQVNEQKNSPITKIKTLVSCLLWLIVKMLIIGGATLTFDVRLVKLNDAVWSDEVSLNRNMQREKWKKCMLFILIQVRDRKVLGWEEIYKPEVCEAKANWDDQLHMHYEATRFSSYWNSTSFDNLFCSGRMVPSLGP